MRTAFLPTVVKRCAVCEDRGKYVVVDNRYSTSPFAGEKGPVITALGTRGRFLGIAYVACGGACAALTLVVLVATVAWPRALGEAHE